MTRPSKAVKTALSPSGVRPRRAERSQAWVFVPPDLASVERMTGRQRTYFGATRGARGLRLVEVEPDAWVESGFKGSDRHEDGRSGKRSAGVADLPSGELSFVGESGDGRFLGLANALFRNVETLRSTVSSLEGQLLPCIWTQGRASCVVCKPNSNTIVGLFFEDEGGPVERSQRANVLNFAVSARFR